MSKHTPGPWHSCSDGSKAWVKSTYKNRFICQMSADLERCDAEARLVSAAPEMLQALRKLCYSHGLEGHARFEREFMPKVRALIAEVEAVSA